MNEDTTHQSLLCFISLCKDCERTRESQVKLQTSAVCPSVCVVSVNVVYMYMISHSETAFNVKTVVLHFPPVAV